VRKRGRERGEREGEGKNEEEDKKERENVIALEEQLFIGNNSASKILLD